MKNSKSLIGLVIALLWVISLPAQQRPGSFKGTITDAKAQEPVPFANVVLLKDSLVKFEGSSDFDGKFNFNPITPGTYNVKIASVGYASVFVKDVLVSPNVPTVQDFQLKEETQSLNEVLILYEAPLIDATKTSHITTAEDIQHMAVRDISSVSSQAAGVTQDAQGNTNVRGARGEGTVYFIDGIKVRGSYNPLAPEPKLYPNEGYEHYAENEFLDPTHAPLSTFSSDVDAAAYANMRRMLNAGYLPQPDAVRIEEMINYFKYDYPNPAKNKTFAVTTNLAPCPWQQNHHLLRVGINTQKIEVEELPANNLVFLIDVSGSMNADNKLPLLKRSLKALVQNMRKQDKVSIVVYASASGVVLPATAGSEKETILAAIDNLSAGGSTAGGAGIKLAYAIAHENFNEKANNRVILATDGDFNVGLQSDEDLVALIEEKRESGVFLSVLGFGSGNYQDGKMEKLADNGNGNYAYIDSFMEAQKVLVQEMGATLNVVAKDTKFQIEFNPAKVQAYRLIGYENRLLADKDFNDDTKDAGDIGSGHSVTALYEIIPTGVKSMLLNAGVDSLKYQQLRPASTSDTDEWATVKIRHKKPGRSKSTKEVHVVQGPVQQLEGDFAFTVAVAGLGLVLQQSEYKGQVNYKMINSLAETGLGDTKDFYRLEFVRLLAMAQALNQDEEL